MTKMTRRTVITAGAAAAGVALNPLALRAQETGAAGRTGAVPVRLLVNGKEHRLDLDGRTTVLDALREHLLLTGTKKGCDQGQCGACTVHIGGERVLSCLTLAVSAQGAAIDTIEGLSPAGGPLHPMQQAFIDQDGFQCGYCTPGQIMSAVACVKEGHAGTDDDIREYMSGNLCRCAAYPKIVAAIKQARGHMNAPGPAQVGGRRDGRGTVEAPGLTDARVSLGAQGVVGAYGQIGVRGREEIV